MFQFNIVFGILVAFASNALLAGIGENAWRWMLGLLAIPSAVFFLLLFSVPESPRNLVKRGRSAAAKMALDAGLVTALKGRTDVEERLVQITGANGDDETYIGVDHWSYLANLRSQEALSIAPSNKVGVIVATGEIVPGEQPPIHEEVRA